MKYIRIEYLSVENVFIILNQQGLVKIAAAL